MKRAIAGLIGLVMLLGTVNVYADTDYSETEKFEARQILNECVAVIKRGIAGAQSDPDNGMKYGEEAGKIVLYILTTHVCLIHDDNVQRVDMRAANLLRRMALVNIVYNANIDAETRFALRHTVRILEIIIDAEIERLEG